MHFLLGTCPKEHREPGHQKEGSECERGGSCAVRRKCFSHFTTRTPTVQTCPVGSKGWSRSYVSVDCGPLTASTRNVKASSVSLDEPTAAVAGSCLLSLISQRRDHNSKNSSSRAVISVTSTPDSTQRRTLLSSTGATQSTITGYPHLRATSMKWRLMSRLLLTRPLLSKFAGVFCCFRRITLSHVLLSYRWANRATRHISAYALGLDGAEAAFANRKFHGHRMLPPDMVVSVRSDFRKWLESKNRH